MNKTLLIALLAGPAITMSSVSFAATAADSEPMQLTAVEMDGVTAGWFTAVNSFNNTATILQGNLSPVTVVQFSQANGGSGSGNNAVGIWSGNSLMIHQHH